VQLQSINVFLNAFSSFQSIILMSARSGKNISIKTTIYIATPTREIYKINEDEYTRRDIVLASVGCSALQKSLGVYSFDDMAL